MIVANMNLHEVYDTLMGVYFYREHPFGPILSGYLCVLFDGISFFTTFMPLSDMSKSQQEAIFEECMKDIDNLES